MKKLKKIKENKILTKAQILFLENFIKSDLCNIFKLSGGTALSAFYLEHRYSYDLDFFSKEKISSYVIIEFLRNSDIFKIKEEKKFFDRNIFVLKFKNGTLLNVEFVYYPLKNLKEPNIIDGLMVESFLDIIVNKLCAIADRCEIKDYVDFYFAFKKSKLPLKKLFEFAEKKCEIKGISDILKYKLLKIPKGIEEIIFIKNVDEKEIENYFRKEIKKILQKEFEN
jgi:predicted nucleotidyltransferase component of viral defense system